MTEEEYRSMDQFKCLPLFNDDDPRCEAIDRCTDPEYTGEVLEADDVTLAYDYSGRANLVPKGGIRYHADDGTFIFAYFWKRK